MKRKLAIRRTLILLFVVVFFGVSFLAFAENRDISTLILGSSWEEGNAIELSGQQADESSQLSYDEPVYYQFQQEKEIVTLALAGDVSKIIMIEPAGEKEDRIVLGASTLVLGASAKEPSIPESRLFSKASLGESQVAERAIETDNKDFFQQAVKTDFAMGEDGEYQFALYDSKDELITTLDFPFLRLAKGEAEISYHGGKTNLSFLEDTIIMVDYNPVANVAEELYVYLPPYFQYINLPTNSPGVAYTKWSEPGEKGRKFYVGAENGQKFIDAVLKESGGTGFGWSTVFNQGIKVSIDPSVDQTVSFSFTIKRHTSYYMQLGKVIFNMGIDLKDMPLLTVVEKGVDGGVANSSILYGNTLFGESATPFTLHKPNVPTSLYGLPSNPPRIQGNVTSKVLQTASPYYPIGDISFLLPFSNGMAVNPSNPPFTHTNGLQYVEKKSTITNFNNSLLTSNTSANSNISIFGTDVVVELMPPTYFKGGESIDLGSTLIRYTQYGIPREELLYTVTPNFIVPKYPSKTSSQFFARLDTSAVVWITSESARRIKQGLTFENIKTTLDNRFSWNQLPYVFLDATYHVKFPYEISPESVRLFYAQSGTKPVDNTMETHPLRLRYKVHGSDQEYTVPVSLSQTTIMIPQNNGRVSDVFLDYETIFANNDREYYFTSNISKKDIDGNPLANEHKAFVETNITTLDGNRIEGYTSGSPKYVPIGENEKSINQIILEGDGEDSLIFGTMTAERPTFYHPYDTNLIHTGNIGRSDYMGAIGSTGLNPSDKLKPWYFAFLKLDAITKNYEELVIDITAKTENDKKALSKVSGISLLFEKSLNAIYTTNLVPTERTKVLSYYSGSLNLPTGEYLTGLKLIFKDINGSKIPMNDKEPTGELLNHKYTGSEDVIALLYSDSPNYFHGTREQIRVKDGDTFQLVATASTGDGGRYITPGNPEFKNNTSTGTIIFQDHTQIVADLSNLNMGLEYGNNSLGYLGSIMTPYINRPVKLYQRSTNNIALSGRSNSDGLEDYFKDPKTKLYIEVKRDFDVLSVPGFTRESVADIPLRGTKLYVFKINLSAKIKDGKIPIDLYIRPTAKIGVQEALIGVGLSYEDLINSHTPTSGPDAYYRSDPYFEMTYVDGTKFPDYWNIPVTSGNIIGTIYKDFSNLKITVNHAQVDGIDVFPGVGGNFAPEKISFKEHQKDILAIMGSITNSSGVSIASYTMRMELPREDGTTENATGVQLNNQFSIFLTTPLRFPDRTDALIEYYDANGNPIPGIDENSTLAELANVKYVDVTVTDFAAKSGLGFDAEFATDRVKSGIKTEDIYSYVGFSAKRSEIGGGGTDFIHANPATYIYQSYTFTNYFGLDPNHIGGANVNPFGSVEVTVLAKAQDGSDIVVYSESPTVASQSIAVNLDAYKVLVKANDSTRYAITFPNMLVISENLRSRFPTPNFPDDASGEMIIDPQHLISGVDWQFNAGFLEHIVVTLPDIQLVKGGTAAAAPVIKFAGGDNVNPTILGTATRVYNDTVDPTIATINASGMATGIKNGETTYTYTFTTPVGYKVIATGKIIVAPPTSDYSVGVSIYNAWLPHGDPIVFVKAEGISSANLGRMYYQLVKLDGGTSTYSHLNTNSGIATKTVTFPQIINGDYKISVVPASRMYSLGIGQITRTVPGSDPMFTFQLEAVNLGYLSDTDKGILTFKIT